MSSSDILHLSLSDHSLANPSKKQYVHRKFLMSIFSLFKSDRLTPEWTYSGGSIIWRMVLAENGRIVGECRNSEEKVASFFCLDMSTGKALWGDLCLGEPWWVGIEDVQKNVVLLHAFAKPDMPEHKGIRAIDTASGVQLWRNDDVSYWFGHEDRVLAYRDFFERRVGYEFDLQSGLLLKTHDTSLEELHALRGRAAEEESLPEVALPEIFVEEEADAALAALVRKETKGKELSGRVEYIRQDDAFVFNFHAQTRDKTGYLKLENNLVVYRLQDNKRVFAEVIGRHLTRYVPDSFFVKHPFVLYIKDQRVLAALRLWKS